MQGRARRFPFPKGLRVRRSADYRRIQGRGRRMRAANLLALALPASARQSRVGITVSRKVGNAVVRNRVKRWLREAIRHALPRLAGEPAWDVVLIAHPQSHDVGLDAIAADVNAIFDRLLSGRSPGPRRDRP